MRVVILAGGLGTRLAEETDLRPKPMAEIGGRPILWHIMKIFGTQDFSQFYVALGYKGEYVKRYFLEHYALEGNMSVNLASGQIEHHAKESERWQVHLIDTGAHSMTGGRLKRLQSYIKDEPFIVTYGDGLANIDLKALLKQHRQNQTLGTVTAVRPPARFGEIILDGTKVAKFSEKPQTGEGWINGGFIVLEPAILDLIGGDDSILERDVLEILAARGQLGVYCHQGFWQCMDTLRDKRSLEALWESGKAPWKLWS